MSTDAARGVPLSSNTRWRRGAALEGARVCAHADYEQTICTASGLRPAARVECTACGQRARLRGQEVKDLQGNMRELRRHKFVCSKCGSRAWRGWLFFNDETRDWREGQLTVSPADGGRPTF